MDQPNTEPKKWSQDIFASLMLVEKDTYTKGSNQFVLKEWSWGVCCTTHFPYFPLGGIIAHRRLSSIGLQENVLTKIVEEFPADMLSRLSDR